MFDHPSQVASGSSRSPRARQGVLREPAHAGNEALAGQAGRSDRPSWRAPGDRRRPSFPASRSLALAALTVLGASPAQDKDGDGATRTWHVRGRTVDAAGEAIAGVCVRVQDFDGFTREAVLAEPQTRSDAEGRFELTMAVADRPHDHRAPVLAADGLASAVLLPARGMMMPLAEGADAEVRVVMTPAAVLKGRVCGKDGRPLAGARVMALDPLARLLGQMTLIRRTHVWADATLTGEDGAFELRGVNGGGAFVRVTAAGHYRVDLPFVCGGDPLQIELTPGGSAEGIVKDANGRPRPGATVWLTSVVDEEPHAYAAGADGRFEVPLPHPHAYRIHAVDDISYRLDGRDRGVLLHGPARGVELTAGIAFDPRHSLVVGMTDAETGRAVEQVRAAALWQLPEHLADEAILRHSFATAALRLRGPGEVRLPGPGPDEPETGIVVLEAEGYARLVLPDVEWSATHPPRLEAKFIRESALAGVVVDAATGAPVAGATLLLGDEEFTPWLLQGSPDAAPGRRITDAAGRFRVGGLPAGRYQLRVAHARRPSGEPAEFELRRGQERTGVEIVAPAGWTLTGRLAGGQVPAGTEVEVQALAADGGDRWISPFERVWRARRVPVASDGSFAMAGLATGEHQLRVVFPHRGGRGGHVEVEVEKLRVEGADLKRDFDLAAVRPGSIRGKVAVSGVEVPNQRLAVCAYMAPKEGIMAWREEPYVVEPLAADGSFELPAAPIRQRLEVVDLATRVPLAVKQNVTVAGGRATEVNLDVPLVLVRVRLVPETKGEVAAAGRLEVLVRHPRLRVDLPSPDGMSPFDTGVGPELAGRTADVELLLPPVPTKLVVRAYHARVYENQWEEPPLGEASLTPEAGEPTVVEIEVKVPKPGTTK